MKNGENNNGKVADKTYLISLIINIDWIFELWDRFLFFIIIILIDKRTLNFYQFMSCKHRYENRLMY